MGTMEKYEGLEGVRAYAIIGILLMHVLSNGAYQLTRYFSILDSIISEFGNFAFLFMTVSAFGMCCGYYDKIKSNEISPNEFYTKRYKKIWPYFALLCVIDLLFSPSISSLYEAFANLTLVFSLLPNPNISVIGVSWTLGVIFVFYIMFPFFVFLLDNKKRTVYSFCVSILLNVLCQIYFMDINHVVQGYDYRANIIYCSLYFMLGGLIYVYRREIKCICKKNIVASWIACLLSFFCFFKVGCNPYTILLVCSMIMCCAISCGGGHVLVNPFTRFIGSISFEIYLCHMMIYRLIEKMHLAHIFGNGIVSYIVVAGMTLGGSIIFAMLARYVLCHFQSKLQNRKGREKI